MKKEEEEWYHLFEEYGGIRKNHFILSSGKHSSFYIQCQRILMYPDLAERIGITLAEKFSNIREVDAVVGAALGGIILSHTVAKALSSQLKRKVRSLFAERVEKELILRRGQEIKRKDKVLIVEDVITTGTTVKELIELVKEKYEGEIVGIGAIVQRSENLDSSLRPYNLQVILKLIYDLYSPEECRLCKAGIAWEIPGSKALLNAK